MEQRTKRKLVKMTNDWKIEIDVLTEQMKLIHSY